MSRGATARLFVAVDPPELLCEELAAWGRDAVADWASWTARRRPGRAPRLVDAEAQHLTLCFLGSRPVGEIEALSTALERCEEPIGELSLGAPLWLPARRARTLAVEIRDHDGGLAAVQARLSDVLSQASGWEPERRRYRPHITIARMAPGVAPRRAATAMAGLLPPTPSLRFTPVAIVLYRSWPGPAGSRYETLATRGLPLAG
jgi:RNA 2',3'-cyclic 3'-phosphodiesterase